MKFITTVPGAAPAQLTFREVEDDYKLNAGESEWLTREALAKYHAPYQAAIDAYNAAAAAAAASSKGSALTAAAAVIADVTTLSAMSAGTLHALSLAATQDYLQKVALTAVYNYSVRP